MPASEGSEHEGNMLQLKQVVKTLKQNEDSCKKTSVSIRRESMFQDYIEARNQEARHGISLQQT